MRSVNKLPNEVWHSRSMRVEEEYAKCWRHRYLPGLGQTNSLDKEGEDMIHISAMKIPLARE